MSQRTSNDRTDASFTVIPPRKRGIQYAAAFLLYHWRLWNTGSSAFADDDDRVVAPWRLSKISILKHLDWTTQITLIRLDKLAFCSKSGPSWGQLFDCLAGLIDIPSRPNVAQKALSSLLDIPGGTTRRPRRFSHLGTHGKSNMVGRNYFKRQAATLIKFAQSTSDPQTVAALIEKADELSSQGDEAAIPSPDLSPRAPDIEPESRA